MFISGVYQMKRRLLITVLFFFSAPVVAKLKVYTTTTNLEDVTRQIGGHKIQVESLCKGTQDPHFLEAKPSYTFKLSKADLLISIGAGLEEGWLPLIIRGSRNPSLRQGEKGHLVTSSFVKLIGRNEENVTRAQGDVHPEGNPHFMLSPEKSLLVAKAIQDKLIELDKDSESSYRENFKNYSQRIKKLQNAWKQRLVKGTKVISYHKTLEYFYQDFGILNLNVLEPKPGIPPTASHILDIIKLVKNENVEKIIVENYFDDAVAKRIQKDLPSIKILTVPVAVRGKVEVTDIFTLYEYLVKKIGGI